MSRFCFILLLPSLLAAELSMPPIFSDHMVLQRDRPVAIWGTAAPGETITVSFDTQQHTTTTRPDGSWQLFLDPIQKGVRICNPHTKPPHSQNSPTGGFGDPPPLNSHTLHVSANNTQLTFSDILIGEVWLASGQSNMEKPLGEMRGQKPTENHEEELRNADYPNIRLFQIPRHGVVKNAEAQMRWLPCTPANMEATQFSAAAYYFAREVFQQTGVPIGLIHSSYGGSMIEAWIPRDAFLNNPQLAPLLEEKYFAWVEGVQATELYQSMIQPLAPYSLRGFLWYQGEANLMNGDSSNYIDKQRTLIQSWRNIWNDPQAPFFFVQLAPFNYSDWDKFPKRQTPEALPLFWEAQTACLEIPNTAMVVTTDLAGDARDIHPIQKREVGQRLAGLALSDIYGQTSRISRSPAFDGIVRKTEHEIEIRFRHAGNGLKSRDGKPLSHFQIAAADGNFVPAQATISDNRIILSNPEVANPQHIRFAWHETATPNLTNSSNLPAIPFRTDTFPVPHIQKSP